MDDFRLDLTAIIDEMLARGVEPVFLVVDLHGAEEIKPAQGQESLDRFRQSVVDSIVSAARGGDAFAYGDLRVIGILPGPDRLRTFSIIDKLRRALPIMAQSYDCNLYPQFDTLEYDPATGVAGLMSQIVVKPLTRHDADVA